MSFAKAILCLTAFGSCFHWAVSAPTVKLAIPGDRKYLVIGEFAQNFLYCHTTGIRQNYVLLCLQSKSGSTFLVDSIKDPRYHFHCSGTTNVTCVLDIKSVKYADSGTYTCANFDCNATAHDNLDVLAYNMPLIDQLTAFPSNGTVRKGRSFFLDCSVNIPTGFAHWSMEWRLNGEVVKSQSVLSNFTYSLAHVNRNDSGSYSCAVLRNGNEIDLQNYPAPLNVTYAAQVTLFEVHSPNRLINASGTVYAEAGTNVTFECTADGNPAPLVAIRYSQDVVTPKLSDNVSRSITLNKGSNDTGVYSCEAYNSENTVRANKSIHFIVYEIVKINDFALNDTENNTLAGCSRHVIAGDRETLQCTADGVPTPSVAILNESGVEVATGLRYAYHRFSAEKNETYECRAKTAVINSTADAKFVLCVTPRPYAPRIISFFVRSSNLLINVSGTIYAEAGTNVTFDCTADGYPVPSVAIQFRGDDDELITQSSKFLKSVSRNVSWAEGKRDTGFYICNASNGNNVSSESIYLFVYEKPEIVFFALNQTNDTVTDQCSAHLIAGDERTLRCTAGGDPPPFVVIVNEKGNRVANGSHNAFYRFTARKNETFECQAETAAINSAANATVELCVTPRPYAPQITSFVVRSSNRLINVSGTIYAEAGTNVTFDCTADGYPVPSVSIQFRRDNDELVTQSSKFLSNVSRDVTRAEGKRDTGFYICNASNSRNISSQGIYLFVYENPKIIFFALNQTNDNVTDQCSAHVTAGDERTLRCTADGNPHPSVVILNEKGERVANGSRNAFYRFTAKKNETYECRAKTTAINSAANATFALCVMPRPYAPRITSFVVRSSNRLINESGTVYAETGTNVTFECKADGYPLPSVAIRYSHDEERVGPKQLRIVSRNVTRAEGKRDTGFYVCEASNSENVSSESIHFFVYENTKIVFFALNHTNDGVNDTVTGRCKNVTSGAEQTLRCKADGDPPPSVVILNENGKQVASGLRNAFYRFSANKNETYKCQANIAVARSIANAKFFLCVSTSPSSFPVWIAITASVVFALIITLLIVTCAGFKVRPKKKYEVKQKEEEEEKNDKEDLELDVLKKFKAKAKEIKSIEDNNAGGNL